MSYHERKNLVWSINTALFLAGFFLYLLLGPSGALFASAYDAGLLARWGELLVIVMVVKIVWSFVLEKIFDKINTCAFHEERPTFTDERDHLIQMRADKNAFCLFMMGFFLAMVSLALQMPVYVTFNLFVVSFLGTQLMTTATKVVLYRKGLGSE